MALDDIEKQYREASRAGNSNSNKFPYTTEENDSINIPSIIDSRVRADKLSRKLSARQVQMIAIGGTIGTGLFVGTGKSLATGGPASMLIAYAICGGIVFVTMLCLCEMAAFIPIAGSFCMYARYVWCEEFAPRTGERSGLVF